ncbi:hypothetical protein GCM10009613_07600 [Pseudonocardia kongjuensis]|uniref:Uncharacterized protein n=1 Tax=Pseudonocardia kongjuensis TaxID=102227 RepID=A0ABN1XJ07_9PSEU
MSLRLPTGSVTVLLGPSVHRRRTMNRLDDTTGRDPVGRRAAVLRIRAREADPVADRLATVASVRGGIAAVVLVDRLTDGLGSRDRGRVLAALRGVAADGTAVLVDDVDPVAALAVADGALRVDDRGGIEPEELAYLAS